jgi:hypothetical protein
MRARLSTMSAMEYFGSTPRKSGRSPACKFRSTSTVGAFSAAAMFVATNEVPQPPLLEKTAIMRPFFFAGAFCPAQNAVVRSSTVLNSSVMTGRRRNSRAPARKERRMRSAEALRAAEMMAVCGISAASLSMSLSACSALASDSVMTAALGRRLTISA